MKNGNLRRSGDVPDAIFDNFFVDVIPSADDLHGPGDSVVMTKTKRFLVGTGSRGVN